MARYYGGYYERFERTTPKAVKGGIKAQSKRGGFGQSWWAKRWIAVLESFNIGARLGRGRSYARNGQVISIDIEKGVVKAKVQGSRTKPYDVTIKVKLLLESDWKKLMKALSNQVLFAAKLLAGEMPQDIEQVFKEAGLSLFPQKLKDIETDCSCPDWSNPCKHIAAVYYLLGEEFDRNPFIIFKLRGMEREQLLAGLGEMGEWGEREELEEGGEESEEKEAIEAKGKKGSKAKRSRAKLEASDSLAGRGESAASGVIPAETAPGVGPEMIYEMVTGVGAGMVSETLSPAQPLDADGRAFWKGGEVPDDLSGEVRIPPMRAALLKRLGNFPFWRGKQPVQEIFEPVYARASQHGMDVFLYEAENSGSEESVP